MYVGLTFTYINEVSKYLGTIILKITFSGSSQLFNVGLYPPSSHYLIFPSLK